MTGETKHLPSAKPRLHRSPDGVHNKAIQYDFLFLVAPENYDDGMFWAKPRDSPS
jgi:hypothetical protein